VVRCCYFAGTLRVAVVPAEQELSASRLLVQLLFTHRLAMRIRTGVEPINLVSGQTFAACLHERAETMPAPYWLVDHYQRQEQLVSLRVAASLAVLAHQVQESALKPVVRHLFDDEHIALDFMRCS
jgi:hypothetical protein